MAEPAVKEDVIKALSEAKGVSVTTLNDGTVAFFRSYRTKPESNVAGE